MHVCIIVRINCQNKLLVGGRQSTVAGLQLHLCCCGTATHACVSVSSKYTGHWPQRWCSNTTLSAINWPALQRLSFSIVICFVEAVIPTAALASLIFQPHNTFRSAAEKFWRKVKPIAARLGSWHITRRTLGGLGDISVLDGHGS